MGKLLSVGIDIGTSTTQLILSELYVENTSSAFTIPQVSITDKKVIYKSDIIFTPIGHDNLIEVDKIGEFVAKQYKKAGVSPNDIQTGAVIITGETVRKENSRAVADTLSSYAGDFVVATAGPDLESIIAGKGSGSASFSKKKHTTTMNFDIGGGTTNLAVFDDGDTVDTTCFDIGGRLIKVDDNQIVQYISPKYTEIIKSESIRLSEGQKLNRSELDKLFDIVIQVMENMVGLGQKSKYYDFLITDKAFSDNYTPDYISFSGGVADFINKTVSESDKFKFNDIGILLGERISSSALCQKLKVIDSVETIRATVVGAGSHTTSVTGSTIMYSGDDMLPIKNVPVLKLSKSEEQSDDLNANISRKIEWFDVEGETQNVAIAFEGKHNPSFQDIQELAKNIVEGAESLIEKNLPLIIILKEDMAKALGHSIYSLLPIDYQFICIDSVIVNDGDYIDLGKPISEGQVLPVVIKTLVFN